jgi:methylenetetrahydrofolate dehydrogenase (NADP+)/methenyltetrahydrofolate cyclohydrolase
MKVDGRLIATNILNELKTKILQLKEHGIIPTMAVILIGDVESSNAYVRQKELKAKEIGAAVKIFRFDETVTNEEISDLIKQLDADKNIHGIILQRPTPESIKAEELEQLISSQKEIDGFGKNSLYTVPVAAAVFEILGEIFGNLNEINSFNVWLKSKKVVVLGKGETAGQPIINYFSEKEIQPLVVDSKTENIKGILSSADIIISAVGKRGVIKIDELKQGVILIGVGLSASDDGKTRGDYDETELEQIASFYTPTPGGVGPVNVALLMENLVEAAQNLSK